jgi:hypothetical protein
MPISQAWKGHMQWFVRKASKFNEEENTMKKQQKPTFLAFGMQIRLQYSKELDALSKQVLFPSKVAQSRALLDQVAWE